MSSFAIFICVAIPTLIAVVITLCFLRVTSLRSLERNRPPTLAESTTEHEGLSSILSSTRHFSRRTTASSTESFQRASATGQTLSKGRQVQVPSPAEGSKLHSVQSIQARSAALRSNNKRGKVCRAEPLMPAYAPEAQRQAAQPRPVCHSSSPSSPDISSDSADPQGMGPLNTSKSPDIPTTAIAPQPGKSTPKDGDETTTTTTQPDANQTMPDDEFKGFETLALPDISQLNRTDTMKEIDPDNLESDLLDILTGMGEDGIELAEIFNDLNEIDGGDLPSSVQKTSPKS